jgi:hypothetical protein
MPNDREQTPDISVDNASINALLPSCRRDIYKIAIAAQNEALESILRAAKQSSIRAILTVASIALAGWHSFVNFWNIPVLGPSDSRSRF